MNEYRKIALEARRKVSKLTLEQQREILKLYEYTIDNLASKATKSKEKSLTKRWTLDYHKELIKATGELKKDIGKQIKDSLTKSAKLGVEPKQLILRQIFRLQKIDPGNHFSTLFSQVQKNVVENIVSGGLYKDNKTLSDRIWSYGNKFEEDIQYIINIGILERKSVLELARDLEKFAKAPAKRPWSWGKVYPNLRGTKVDYNAQRLARTSINHAYQTASIKSSSMNQQQVKSSIKTVQMQQTKS